jgi:hypothetical protein
MTHPARGRPGLRPSSGASGLASLDHCLLRRAGGQAGGNRRRLLIANRRRPSEGPALTHGSGRHIIVLPSEVVPYWWPNGGPLMVASDKWMKP